MNKSADLTCVRYLVVNSSSINRCKSSAITLTKYNVVRNTVSFSAYLWYFLAGGRVWSHKIIVLTLREVELLDFVESALNHFLQRWTWQ